MLEDHKIIELFFERAENAIAKLSEKYGTTCIALSRNILKNESDAEECINDAYLAVWNRIPPERPDPLRAYLLRIVRNISITRYHSNTAQKRNSYYDVALDELEACLTSSHDVEQEYDSAMLSHHINLFLDTLDKPSRVMFIRRYWCADSVSDIAKQLSITENNVYVKLSRIRDRLREYLQKEGYVL